MSLSDQEAAAFVAATNSRLESLEQKLENLKGIEPALKFLHDNLDYFKALVSGLDSKIALLENAVLTGLPAQIAQQGNFDKTEIVREVASLTKEALRPDIEGLRRTLDDFRRDATAIYATKNDLLSRNPASDIVTHKGKMALPDAFSGKRDDWKVFSSHLTLYLTANAAAYPTDSDKILFAVSRLGDGSAFKYMMQFIPKLKDPVAFRPAIITSFEQFLTTMKETFGVQNANVVAETQLLQLQQKGSAVDYTNKFQELASDLEWNDSALIAHYRRGLKPDVIKAIDMLDTIPTMFASFTQKAIDVDSKQYASHLELRNRSSSSKSPSNSVLPMHRAQQPQPTYVRPPLSPSLNPQPMNFTPPSYDPSMAMDLSQVRHINTKEKKRRQENGLCLYCGEDDHFAKFCPEKKTLASLNLAETSFDTDSFTFTLGNDAA